MAKSRPRFERPGSDDPLSLAQSELEDRPKAEARPRRSMPGPSPARTYDDFPPKPDNRSERTWRLVRLFIETGKESGRTRVVSPWQLGEDLVVKINHDPAIVDFMAESGTDLAEDLLGRMIRIYWNRYVDSSMTRSQIVNQFLDDLWPVLWDEARTQYATDEIQRLEAAGQLKARPPTRWHSLANDTDYQAALEDLRLAEQLKSQVKSQLMDSNEQLESDSPDQQS